MADVDKHSMTSTAGWCHITRQNSRGRGRTGVAPLLRISPTPPPVITVANQNSAWVFFLLCQRDWFWFRGNETQSVCQLLALGDKIVQKAAQLDPENSCSLCLDFLKDSLGTSCGKSYCRKCLQQHRDTEEIQRRVDRGLTWRRTPCLQL